MLEGMGNYMQLHTVTQSVTSDPNYKPKLACTKEAPFFFLSEMCLQIVLLAFLVILSYSLTKLDHTWHASMQCSAHVVSEHHNYSKEQSF